MSKVIIKPEDHWSCIAHLIAEDMLKSVVIEEKTLGRGRLPIRAKILMSTGRPHHYGHLLQVYKESLQPLTLYTSFHDLINVYSRRSGADNPRGQNFDETETSCHFSHLLQVSKKSL